LTFPNKFKENTTLTLRESTQPLKPYVEFVAIKNGMHEGEGFAFFTKGVAAFAPAGMSYVKELYGTVMGYFGGNR
jgi:hypothetical protein